MATTRKEALEKEKKAILAKDFVTKNEVLTSDHVEDLFNLFHLYADARTKRADIRDILVTARTLGLNDKYAFVFKALEGVCDGPQGNELDFETFVKDLTAKIGSPFSEVGRKATFDLLDMQGKEVLELEDLRYINDQLKYGYKDEQLLEIIKNVGGYEAKNISLERWNKFIQRKVDKQKFAL